MKITVKDFQSLRDVSLDVEGLTVVVGPSNLGKSALVRAVEGALFNREGDAFVRQGRTRTTVTLDDVPTAAAPLEVLWEKGHNLNQFTVGGTLFAKVGTDAPPVLVEAGYRDVWIGDRERNRGEWIRPQVSHQHDPMFLLASTGSFVAQVMSVVSRLATLQLASGKCSSDLKKQKHLLGVRREDLTAARKKLDTLQPILALHERVTALRQRVAEYSALDHRVGLARRLVEQRRALAVAAAGTLPEAVAVPEFRYAELRDLVVRRAGLAKVTALPIPITCAARAGEVLEAAGRLDSGQRLSSGRGLIRGAAASVLPPAKEWANAIPKVEHWQARVDRLREFDGIRKRALLGFDQAVSSCRASKQEAEQADLTLQDTLAALKICPVCERPMVTP